MVPSGSSKTSTVPSSSIDRCCTGCRTSVRAELLELSEPRLIISSRSGHTSRKTGDLSRFPVPIPAAGGFASRFLRAFAQSERRCIRRRVVRRHFRRALRHRDGGETTSGAIGDSTMERMERADSTFSGHGAATVSEVPHIVQNRSRAEARNPHVGQSLAMSVTPARELTRERDPSCRYSIPEITPELERHDGRTTDRGAVMSLPQSIDAPGALAADDRHERIPVVVSHKRPFMRHRREAPTLVEPEQWGLRRPPGTTAGTSRTSPRRAIPASAIQKTNRDA